jgi:GAF domain-containing protein
MSDPRLSTLTTLASLLQDLPTVPERLQQALTYACGALAAERGVMIPNHRYYPLMPPATYGCTPAEWLSPRFAFARSLVFHTFQNGAASLTSDAQPDYRHDIAQAIGLHSIVCAPVLHQPSPHAVLCLQRRLTTAPFTPDDLDLLECIAAMVGNEG